MKRWLEEIGRPEMVTRLLWIIGAAGLAVRLVLVLMTQNIGGVASLDSSTYHSIATNLLAGRGFSQDGINPTLFVAPLYPFFLAAVYRVAGVHPLLVELLQVLFGVASAFLAWLITRARFGRMPGLIAFVLVLFLPELMVINTYLYTESFFIFLFLLAIWLAMRALEGPSAGALALAGLAGGLATLTRGVTMLLPLVLLLAFLLRRRGVLPSLRHTLLYALFFALPIVPWTMRNYHTFGAAVPIAVGSGDVLWTGNYRPHDGRYSYDKTMAVMDSMTAGLNQVDRDELLTGEALKHIKADPPAAAGLGVKKFFRFWFWVYEGAPSGMKREGGGLVQLILALSYYPILLLFCAGVWLSRRRWRELAFIHLVLGYYMALHVVMLVVPRYRIPVLPLLIFFAAFAVWEACGLISGGRRGAEKF
ncbi:MAG TPA: glycosyltransferase family 39 protein [bacterium]|nr:glycosyltransferase family 39 protein [bacterium]